MATEIMPKAKAKASGWRWCSCEGSCACFSRNKAKKKMRVNLQAFCMALSLLLHSICIPQLFLLWVANTRLGPLSHLGNRTLRPQPARCIAIDPPAAVAAKRARICPRAVKQRAQYKAHIHSSLEPPFRTGSGALPRHHGAWGARLADRR